MAVEPMCLTALPAALLEIVLWQVVDRSRFGNPAHVMQLVLVSIELQHGGAMKPADMGTVHSSFAGLQKPQSSSRVMRCLLAQLEQPSWLQVEEAWIQGFSDRAIVFREAISVYTWILPVSMSSNRPCWSMAQCPNASAVLVSYGMTTSVLWEQDAWSQF